MRGSTARLIAMLNEGWPGRALTKATATMWAEDLEQWDPAHVEYALRELMKTNERRPSLAAILAATRKRRAHVEGYGGQRALVAAGDGNKELSPEVLQLADQLMDKIRCPNNKT